MRKLYEKNELAFALVSIGIYVVLLSAAENLSNALAKNAAGAALCAAMTAYLFLWLGKNGLRERFGLCRPALGAARYLWYLPLAVIASVNLWCGVTMTLPAGLTALFVFRMLCVGFLEELLFRGFLFRALCRSGKKSAVLISSLTFGAGHIVNLLNGAELVPTLLQIVYAVAVGFLFVVLFLRSGSIVPCILTHSVLNALSVFGLEPDYRTQCFISLALIVIAAAYAAYLLRRPALTSGEACVTMKENTEGD